jgi:hypothetical protein
MFGFLNRSGTSSATAAVQRALSSADLPPGLDPTGLGVVESRGSYAGRKVTYFRVFDPRQTGGQSGKRLRYEDLEARGELVLRAGHVEEDGTVVLNRVLTDEARHQASGAGPNGPGRAPADRTAHPDDERYVTRDAVR